MIIEYEDKYLEDVRNLLVELEEYIVHFNFKSNNKKGEKMNIEEFIFLDNNFVKLKLENKACDKLKLDLLNYGR